jgi:hypothetical protein
MRGEIAKLCLRMMWLFENRIRGVITRHRVGA